MYAKYTEVLKDLMESEQVKPLLDKALSTYPLYAPQKEYNLIPTREQLNKKLLNHYKYREIGFETVGRFLDELEIAMVEIMPRYNELFKTIEIMAELPNPFDNVDVIEEYTEERSSSSSGTTSNTSTTSSETESNSSMDNEVNSTSSSNTMNNKKNVHADTPQDQIRIPANNINDLTYADSVSWDQDYNDTTGTDKSTSNGSSSESGSSSAESSGTSSGNSEESGTLHHTFTKKGNQGVNTYAHDMNEFRTSIIDVQMQIINDKRIAELFMLVY